MLLEWLRKAREEEKRPCLPQPTEVPNMSPSVVKAANDCNWTPQMVGQKRHRPSESNVYSASDRLKIARYAITSVTSTLLQ